MIGRSGDAEGAVGDDRAHVRLGKRRQFVREEDQDPGVVPVKESQRWNDNRLSPGSGPKTTRGKPTQRLVEEAVGGVPQGQGGAEVGISKIEDVSNRSSTS
jgi:hypothetical protein